MCNNYFNDLTLQAEIIYNYETVQCTRTNMHTVRALLCFHYSDVIMGATMSQITSLTIVYSTVYQAQIVENMKVPRHWPLWRHHVLLFYSVRCPKISPLATLKSIEKPSVRIYHELISREVLCQKHMMASSETFSALLALCAGNSLVTGEFPAQRPVMRSFVSFIDIRLNKRLSNQSRRQRFETPSRSLWRHINEGMDN